MPYRDLQEFLRILEEEGELVRVKEPVSPILEITEITDRVTKQGGPALLFENVEGSSFPLLINLFGTLGRMQMALNVDSFDVFSDKIRSLLNPEVPQGLLQKMKQLPKLKKLNDLIPKTVKSAPCKEVIKAGNEVDLSAFPIMQCWPQDAGRYITFPLVFTKDPETGVGNTGVYRMQVIDRRTTGMHWQSHKIATAQEKKYREAGANRMEVAVAIGADPAVSFSGIAPCPEGVDEMLFASFVRDEPVRLVPCETVDLKVPASAEIVLEGYVDPTETFEEGPFGDHTGFYSLPDTYPVFHIECITHRKDAIYQSIIVGKPVQEDCFLGKAVERIFLPLMQQQLPEIVDVALPFEGIFHNLMIVSIDKRYPGHARKVMHAIWGMGQAMLTKVIIVVDKDVDVHSPGDVTFHALNHIDPQRDIEFVLGPIDDLDHSSRLPRFGSHMGVDGTQKWASEGFERSWPDEIVMTKEVTERVDERWPQYGIGLKPETEK